MNFYTCLNLHLMFYYNVMVVFTLYVISDAITATRLPSLIYSFYVVLFLVLAEMPFVIK